MSRQMKRGKQREESKERKVGRGGRERKMGAEKKRWDGAERGGWVLYPLFRPLNFSSMTMLQNFYKHN